MVVAIFDTTTEDYSVVARSFCRCRQNDQCEHWRGVLHHRRSCFAQKRTFFAKIGRKNAFDFAKSCHFVPKWGHFYTIMLTYFR